MQEMAVFKQRLNIDGKVCFHLTGQFRAAVEVTLTENQYRSQPKALERHYVTLTTDGEAFSRP